MLDERIAYTIGEALKVAPIGRSRLFEFIREGHIPAKKLGSRTIIMREDLERFLGQLPQATPGQR